MTAPHPAVLVTGEVDRDSATWTPEPLPRQSARTWEDLEAQS